MMGTLTGKTRVAGIIGSPIAHSLSPLMHNAAFAALKLDYVYVPFPVAVDELATAVAGLRAAGVVGFNATVPHKVALIPLLDEIAVEAQLVGAVNTVVVRQGRLVGYNTDGIGLLSALDSDLGFSPKGRSVLILGAGGAARSAVYALAQGGAKRIVLVNRSIERGHGLVELLSPHFPGVDFSLDAPMALKDSQFASPFDLVVNTSSVGMRGDSFPDLDLGLFKPGALVYDMVYAPPVTPLLAKANELGIACANGLGMLAAQGEAAFEIFTGVLPPKGLMRGVLTDFLAGGNP